jgi:predicted DCC family thiol-disulfide oxidoreductase YuxK
MLYDSECPLCMREVNFLREKDAGRGLVKFVDIADENYNPEENAGVDYETAMGRIHGILPDGTVVRDTAVFRQVYEVLGMGWVYAITKIPVMGWLADQIYAIWAKLRLRLTGRPSLKTLVSERESSQRCRIGEGKC